MYDVTVNKDQLLETLQSNLVKHRAEYEEAVANYPEIVVNELRTRAAAIEDGKEVDLRFALPAPVSYETEYEDAIQMLEWATNDTIVLDQTQFKQYVQDQWRWKDTFAASTQIYNGR